MNKSDNSPLVHSGSTDCREYDFIGSCAYIKTNEGQTIYIDQSITGELVITVWDDTSAADDDPLLDESVKTWQ